MIQRIIFSMLCLLLIASCGDEANLEGVYQGVLVAKEDSNPNNWLTDSTAVMTISQVQGNSFDLSMQHFWGSSLTVGTFTENDGFFSLITSPVLEPTQLSNPFNYPSESGTYDFDNNQMIINLNVTDNSTPFGTNSLFTFNGSKN